MRHLFAFLSLFLMSGFIDAQVVTTPLKPDNPIQKYIDEIAILPKLSGAAISFYVKNMSTGELVADYNGQMALPSASTMKLVTTATASQMLGRNYRFKTKLMYSGDFDSLTGVLNGDLYIVGGGDPTLGSKYYNKIGAQDSFLYEWAEKIKAFGIKKITGKVIGDGSKYRYDGVPTGWVWGDLGNYYGAGPNGLTIYDNMCRLEFSSGLNEGDSTELLCINPYIHGLTIQNAVKAGNGSDDSYVFGAPYSYDWFIRGTIPKGKESFEVKASIPDPEKLMSVELYYALKMSGIEISKGATSYRELSKNPEFLKPTLLPIFEHSSPSLGSIIDEVNQKSINLFAEHLLCEISYKKSGYGSTYNGAQICSNYWSSKAGAGLFMADGSGLSRSNAVSAKFLVELLGYMSKSDGAQSFKNSLAIAGKKGTMSAMCTGTTADGRAYGKSGSMTRIRSYAGYVDSKTGKKLAYGIIFNNFSGASSEITKYCENILVKLSIY
jgi:D-alanyl-D-alanine carboxypeptidase/D-alanyl-D-alanine-endopeptidase (penicillin-binding protein 4)